MPYSNLFSTFRTQTQKEMGKYKIKTHGLSKHPLYTTYTGMKSRCYNKNQSMYYCYGAKGVKVCEKWLNDFKAFYDWAICNGWQKGLQIDRIDNNGNYEPSNCRIATVKENNSNTSRNVLIYYNGETKTLSEWSRIISVHETTLGRRLKNMPVIKAMTRPKHKKCI